MPRGALEFKSWASAEFKGGKTGIKSGSDQIKQQTKKED